MKAGANELIWIYILMYNMDAFLKQEYSYFYKICEIKLFYYLT